MSDELQRHLNKLQTRAVLSAMGAVAVIVLAVFGIILCLVPSRGAVLCFAAALPVVGYLVYVKRAARAEEKRDGLEPVVFPAGRPLTFEDVTAYFEGITEARDRLSLSADVRFFRTDHIFRLRAVVYRTDGFDKGAFDAAKDRINRKANRELEISQWAGLSEAAKMMRFNIICTQEGNEALRRLLSQNALRNLTRAEGVVTLAVAGSEILLPPLCGDCYLSEIRRYRGVIRFIEQAFLDQA